MAVKLPPAEVSGISMKLELVRRLTPEEEELAVKREELARLEAQLADQELLLASLKAELAAFEGLYLRRVGVLYAELDEWNALLAELRAEQAGTPEAKAEADEARTQAEEAYSAAHGEAANVQPFTPSPDLKKLYREAAKRVHPDTATDERDRARRERLMKEVNAAYVAGDEDALRRILAGLDASPDAVHGSGVGADLVRVLRQLKQVRDRIAAIERELVALRGSEIALLQQDVEHARHENRDLLAEIAATVREKIGGAKREHETMATGVKQRGR
jgi:predicted translin family RNA/ssDNA-binding protein